MFADQGPAHDPESMRLILLMATMTMVVFWRTAIKLALIAAMLLAVFGTLTLFQDLH